MDNSNRAFGIIPSKGSVERETSCSESHQILEKDICYVIGAKKWSPTIGGWWQTVSPGIKTADLAPIAVGQNVRRDDLGFLGREGDFLTGSEGLLIGAQKASALALAQKRAHQTRFQLDGEVIHLPHLDVWDI